MCLIVFNWRPEAAGARAPLFTLAANRDEFLARPSAPMQWWQDAENVLAGRDLSGGGTWLGLTRDGRFAALTNYRAPGERRTGVPSRGGLVADYLRGPLRAPLDYLAEVAERGACYNGFTLLVGNLGAQPPELAYYGNRGEEPRRLAAGLYGLSNALLDTHWPKVDAKKAALAALTSGGGPPELVALLDMMRDPSIAPDDALPSTGLPIERERALSAAFIDTPDYGTRGTTALCVTHDGAVEVIERSDCSDEGGEPMRIERPGSFERAYSFVIRR